MMGLRPNTAERIRRILDRSPGSEQTYGTGRWKGFRPTFVRCTSATAADTSGVGAQCYPGIIVDLDPTATTQADLSTGTVWLTLLGAGGLPQVPKSGGVYECLLTGEVEAATSDTRLRAFAVASAVPSADCSGLVSSLKPGRCFRLTISDAGTGSCSCEPVGQSASLTYNSARSALTSTTLLYGCPPGVFTTLCPAPTGAPRKWNLPVAGFTGGYTKFNQNYTISYASGEAWAATKGGVTVTATQTSAGVYSLTLTDGTTTITYAAEGVTGCCSAITFTLTDDGGATGAPSTLTLSPATSCGKGPAYTAVLDKCTTECMRNASLRWEPVAGSGARTILFDPPVCGVDASGNKYADFSTDDPLLCTGTEASGCGDNKFTVRVTCVPCPSFATSGATPCGSQCPDLSAVYSIPQSLCVSYELTAGADCAEAEGYYPLNGRVNSLPLFAGPYANPMSNGFLGSHPGVEGADPCLEEGIGWAFITAHTTLSSGFIFDNGGGADQCGIADGDTAIATSPLTIRFHGGGAAEFTVSYEGSQWLLKYGSQTIVASSFDDAAQTVTFDTSGIHATVFGQDETTFTVGGLPLLYYGDYDGSRVTELHTRATPGSGYEYIFNSRGGDIFLCVDRTPTPPLPEEPGTATLNGNACFLLGGDTEIRTGVNCVSSTYTVTIATSGGCEENPIPTTYVCINGVCTAVYDGSGTSLADCLAACGSTGGGTGGPTSNCGKGSGSGSDSMVVTGGSVAGTYAGTWRAGSPDYEAFDVGYVVVLEFFAGAWHLVWTEGGTIHDITATSGLCSPFKLTFTGGPGGATTTEINP